MRMVMLVGVLCLTGCASMFGDSNDLITVTSNEPEATILLNGNEIGTGKAQYTLPRGDAALITAKKEGCGERSTQTSRKIVGATWLNILFPIGFLVDAATGKMHKTEPTSYTVTPAC